MTTTLFAPVNFSLVPRRCFDADRRQDTVAAARAGVDEYTALIAQWRAASQAGSPVGGPAAAATVE
ncbi:hypothetical protein ACFQZ4_04220 [Catellatospora coxensis]|nr:hypothetical protein [Catellatospora coxensis]